MPWRRLCAALLPWAKVAQLPGECVVPQPRLVAWHACWPQVHGEHTLESVLDVMTRERDTRSQVSMFGGDEKKAAQAAADGA